MIFVKPHCKVTSPVFPSTLTPLTLTPTSTMKPLTSSAPKFPVFPPQQVTQPLLGDKENSPSNSPSKTISPSNRQRGLGNGYIYWRTLTKKGKDYPQAYYHWKENGKKRTKYIPKQLLGLVEEAEKQKRPVIEILKLLHIATSPSQLLGDTENSPNNYKA